MNQKTESCNQKQSKAGKKDDEDSKQNAGKSEIMKLKNRKSNRKRRVRSVGNKMIDQSKSD